MPKAARGECLQATDTEGRAWVGNEVSSRVPLQRQSAKSCSATNKGATQTPTGTGVVETGPGREMLNTVEKPSQEPASGQHEN